MLGLVAIVLFVPALSQGKAWHGIVPLHSARADVERLLGRPSIDRLEAIYYDLADEKVSIHLSMGRCSDRSGSWNIPRNTVISIWVTPKQLHLSDLKVDFTKFDKKQDDELAYIFHYVDSNEGLTYQVDERMSNFVTLIQYFGTRADEKLRCPSKADAPARDGTAEYLTIADTLRKKARRHLRRTGSDHAYKIRRQRNLSWRRSCGCARRYR